MNDNASEDCQLQRVVDLLLISNSILFITGAGISADSGLPTYRGIGGLYNVDDTEDGLPIETLLSGRMMRMRPEATWKYLAQIADSAKHATFNRGHEVIAEMEAHFDRVWTLTQNVDGFHRQAGSANVIDIHGDLHERVCTNCDAYTFLSDFSAVLAPPLCPECHEIMRPNVVLFGETLPEQKVALLWQELENGFDLIFSIGTTSLFPYVAAPVEQAIHMNAATVEINPGESAVTHLVDVKLTMRAAPALDQIWLRYLTAIQDHR